MAETTAAEIRDLNDDELVTRPAGPQGGAGHPRRPGAPRARRGDELAPRGAGSKEELFTLRFQVATGQLDNNRRLHHVRRDIARTSTAMRARELATARAGRPPGGAR